MIIILNNKSNLEKREFLEYQQELEKLQSNHKLVLCPSTIYLSDFKLDQFSLGGQNVSSYENGAYTGEVNAKQLKSLGVEYCIVGHSERRKYQKETNEDIQRKLKNLLNENIIPILCIGEKEKESNQNKIIEVLIKELKECLNGIEDDRVIIAYEPIWAIGSGITPSKESVDNILSELKNIYPKNKLIYGGSLNQENIKEFNKSKIIDGYLIGGLSLKIKELEQFLEEINL